MCSGNNSPRNEERSDVGHGQAMQRGIRMCRGCVIGWWRRGCALFGPRVASDCTEFEEGMPHDWNDGADVHRARSEGSFFREAPRHSSCAISSRGRSRRPEVRRPRAQQQHRIQFKAITPPRIAQTTGSTRDKSSLGHMTTDDRDKATSREAAATPHDAAESGQGYCHGPGATVQVPLATLIQNGYGR